MAWSSPTEPTLSSRLWTAQYSSCTGVYMVPQQVWQAKQRTSGGMHGICSWRKFCRFVSTTAMLVFI
jgi:hypothetical protein